MKTLSKRSRLWTGLAPVYLFITLIFPCGSPTLFGGQDFTADTAAAASAQATVPDAGSNFVVVLPFGQMWRFDDSGSDLGTVWKDIGYDDSEWDTLPSPVGVEQNPLPLSVNNTGFYMQTGIITYYFRTTFMVEEDVAAFDLLFTNLIDDGAVFYLNGEEILRQRMHPWPVVHDTTADRAVSDAVFESHTVHPEHLRNGHNVLAVEVHQVSPASEDIVMGSSLTLVPIPVQPLSFLSHPRSLIVEEGKPAEFSVSVTGRPVHYQWYRDGLALPEATRRQLVVPRISSLDEGVYTVQVFNELSHLTSTPAGLRTFTDTNPPVLLGAEGGTDVNQIMAVFSEALRENSATNLARYQLTNTWGDSRVVLDARWIDATHVQLTTEPRTLEANYILTVSGLEDDSPQNNTLPGPQAAPVSWREELIPWDAVWMVYDPFPIFDPLDPGPEWATAGFALDTNKWFAGRGAFIFDRFAQNWLVPQRTHLSSSGRITVYFRHQLILAGGRSPLGARLPWQHLVDDGAAFYLNGREFLRTNLPEGQLTPTTLASSAINDEYVPIISTDLDEMSQWIVSETNLIAAEAHMAFPQDGDLAFAARLEATFDSRPIGPIVLTRQPTDQIVVEGQSVHFDFAGAGPARLQWHTNRVAVPGAIGPTLTLPAVALDWDGLKISVLAENDESSVWSDEAALQVLPDLSRPRVISAILLPGQSSIDVVFDEPVDEETALASDNYLLDNEGTILDVISIDARTVRLTTTHLPSYGVSLILNGIRDRSDSQHEILPNTKVPLRFDGDVLGFDAEWIYNDSGIDLGEEWRQSSYDYAAWPRGPGMLGSPASEPLSPGFFIQTVLSTYTAQSVFVTNFYFRVHLPIDGPFPGTATVYHVVDDGALFYLNGVEVARVRMPQGPISHHTFATETYEAAYATEQPEFFTIEGERFRPGENLLSVEVHQSTGTSPDIVFGCRLRIQTDPSYEVQSPELEFVRDERTLTLKWDRDDFRLEETETIDGAGTVWMPVPTRTTSHPWLMNDRGRFFRLSQ